MAQSKRKKYDKIYLIILAFVFLLFIACAVLLVLL